MNKYLLWIGKKVIPQPIKDYITCKMLMRDEKCRLESILAPYEKMCNSGVPGFIVLDPYVKTDRIFNGIQYYSQMYQDYYLDQYIFGEKKNGFFLDVGGNDPIKINNTYFFELNRNWSGLAFEPMQKMNQRWKQIRKAECIPVALGNQTGEMEFCEYEEDYMSGLASKVDYDGKIANRYTVKMETLANVLEKRGITHVDFMSLDVEGAELGVLSGIDFNTVTIDYIVIENNKGIEKEQPIRKFLVMHNYRLRAKLWIDEIWEKG